MRKKTPILCLILFTVCLTACTRYDNKRLEPVGQIPEIESFKSIEEFENAERKKTSRKAETYYVPVLPEDQYTLTSVTKWENVYVSVAYHVDLPEDLAGQLRTDYDRERCQSLICQTYLFEDGTVTLQGFLNNGYKETEVNGRTYYRWDEHAENSPGRPVIGYEIVFPAEGRLIFMHLPGVGSFEEMMRYADPVKRVIE